MSAYFWSVQTSASSTDASRSMEMMWATDHSQEGVHWDGIFKEESEGLPTRGHSTLPSTKACTWLHAHRSIGNQIGYEETKSCTNQVKRKKLRKRFWTARAKPSRKKHCQNFVHPNQFLWNPRYESERKLQLQSRIRNFISLRAEHR